MTFKDAETVKKVLDTHTNVPISIDEKTVSCYAINGVGVACVNRVVLT